MQENEKIVKYEGDGHTDRSWYTLNVLQALKKITTRKRNQGKNRDHADYDIAEKSQNFEKSPGDLGWFAVIQIPDNNYLTLGWKARNE